MDNMSGLEIPTNPVELAAIVAESSTSQSFEIMPKDERALEELELGAEMLGFLNQEYFVQAHRGMIMPADFVSSERFTFKNLAGVTLEGKLVTYSKVHIGRIIGAGAVRAFCLAFESATLLPYFDTVPEDRLVHVPVLAVSSIEQTN
jgi:hypothetical protein